MTFPFFAFDVLNMFGFNALFYTEGLIENKITDNERDKFVYPVKNEFGKIIISLVLSVVFLGIVKAIALEIYNKSLIIRRIIAIVIMLVFDIFLFYYCVVFCGIYANAQNGWFYSGVWTIFFVWIVIAPLIIFVLTVIERNCERCIFVK